MFKCLIKKKKSRSGSRTHCRSVLNQLSGSLAVPCDGTGPLWWTARCPFRLLAAGDGSSSRGQPAASPPFPAPPPTWRMAAGSGPLANGGDLLRSLSDGSHPSSSQEHGSESSVPPVLPLLQHHRCGQPLAVSATSCCPISSSTAIPLSSEGSLTACPSFLPGFGTNVMKLICTGKKEAGTGEHSNTFNNQINKHNRKAAAPHGRLPQTKHQTKTQAWSSLVFHCCHSSFYSFRSSSVGLETGEWRRCRSLSFTPPASLRSHGSRPRPTRHIPPSPLAGRGVLTRLRSTPPSPLSRGEPVRAAAAYLGGKDRRGERKETEG